jgi:hypothetical protein
LLAFCPEQEDCKWWGKFPDFEKNQRNEKPHPNILFSAQNKKKKRCNLMIRFRDYQFLEVLLRSSSRQKYRKLLSFCPEQEDCKWWGKFPDFEKNQRNEKPHPNFLFSAQNKKKKRCNLMIRFRDYQFLEVLLRSSSRQKCRKLLAFCPEQEDCKWWGKFPDFEKNQRNEKPHPNILFSAQNKKKKRCNLMISFRDYQFLKVLLRSSSRQKCRKLLAF